MNRYEMLFELIIIFISIFGLITHSGIFKGQFRTNMFLYYTNISNLLVLLYFSFRILIKNMGIQSGIFYNMIFSDFMYFSVTASIIITFLIYHFLLVPRIKKVGTGSAELFKYNSIDNITVHYLVPILTLFNWLLFASKRDLNWLHGVTWMMIPLAYTLFALIRGILGGNIKYSTSPYPYPFMDPTERGWKKVGLNLLVISIVFVSLGIILIGIGKL